MAPLAGGLLVGCYHATSAVGGFSGPAGEQFSRALKFNMSVPVVAEVRIRSGSYDRQIIGPATVWTRNLISAGNGHPPIGVPGTQVRIDITGIAPTGVSTLNLSYDPVFDNGRKRNEKFLAALEKIEAVAEAPTHMGITPLKDARLEGIASRLIQDFVQSRSRISKIEVFENKNLLVGAVREPDILNLLSYFYGQSVWELRGSREKGTLTVQIDYQIKGIRKTESFSFPESAFIGEQASRDDDDDGISLRKIADVFRKKQVPRLTIRESAFSLEARLISPGPLGALGSHKTAKPQR